MRVIIIEDEKPAAEKLRQALGTIDPSLKVDTILTSVKESETWLVQNGNPELIFMDIELTDGLSFAIFTRCKITCPVIFTTAYDEYWQEAFEHNSIDYLLKPIKPEKLQASLNKYYLLRSHFSVNVQQLLEWQQSPLAGYKKRFLVKKGIDLVSIKSEEIAYLYAVQKMVCLVTSGGQKYLLDKSLSDLQKEADPQLFYRINRKYLVNINAIRRIKTLSKSKLQVELNPAVNEEVTLSQDTVAAFKSWMAG